jgi:hypothetical protein
MPNLRFLDIEYLTKKAMNLCFITAISERCLSWSGRSELSPGLTNLAM